MENSLFFFLPFIPFIYLDVSGHFGAKLLRMHQFNLINLVKIDASTELIKWIMYLPDVLSFVLLQSSVANSVFSATAIPVINENGTT